jgi:CP family cyanate transporter-like MFS transporter
MVSDGALHLFRGRLLPVLGIVLVALNVRTAVSAISPIADDIAADIPLDEVSFGALGMIPPAGFAIAGILGSRLTARLGLERFLLVAIVAMCAGHLARGASDSYAVLVVASTVTLIGMGIGNILLPPLVKRYFPERIGAVTALYITMIQLSAALPASLAAPLAEAANWRWSLATWAFLAAASVVPWVLMLRSAEHEHRPRLPRRTARSAQAASAALNLPSADPGLPGPIWRSKVALTLAITGAVSSFNFFAVFAWLPEILVQTAGQTPHQAGALLALYSIVGIPASILVPIVAVRMRKPGLIVQIGISASIAGFAGLWVLPDQVVWLWVLLLSGGQALFPVCLVLINVRSRTPRGSVRLSSFSQGFGYSVATAGPLLIGLLRDASGGWTAVFALMIAISLPALVTGVLINRRAFVEDEIAPE